MCKNVALLFDDLLWNRFVFLKSSGILIVIDREGQKRLRCIRPINWGWTNGDPHSALSEGLVTILKLIQRIENETKRQSDYEHCCKNFERPLKGPIFINAGNLT